MSRRSIPRVRPRRLRHVFAVTTALLLSIVLTTDALAISWSANRALTGAGSGWGSHGGLAVSSSTVAHAVFEQAVLGSWGVYHRRTTNSGTSWSSPVRLSSPAIGEAGAAVVDASGSGVNAVWLESDDILAGSDTVVVHRRSVDAGATWGEPMVLTPAGESAGHPQIARRGSVVVVAWTNQANGRVYAKVSNNGGATFAGRVHLATTTRRPGGLYEAFPAVAIGTGVMYVTYYSATKVLRMRRSTTGGASWRSAVTIAKNGSGWAPSIAASGSVSVIGYAATTSSDSWTVVRRSKDKGANWGGVVSLSPSSAALSFAPVLAVRGSRWMAIFERCTTNRCSASDVYYRSSTNAGGTWSATTKPSVRARKWEAPADVDVAGKTLVMYDDYNSSAQDVYVRQGS